MADCVSKIELKGVADSLRRFAVFGFLPLLAASFASLGVPRQAHAASLADPLTVQVSGGALSNITSSPLAISPVFAATTTDYVLRCKAGINTIQLTLDAVSDGAITIGGRSGKSIAVQESLFENQALVIRASDPNRNGGVPIQYWVRCLPHDFPQLTVTRLGSPPSGWYLTGNILPPAGTSAYAMVLDNNGTPVWYQRASGQFADNITPLADGSIAWISDGPGFADYNLLTQATRWFTTPDGPTDIHELEEMSNGDLMMLSNPTKSNVDLTALGLGPDATIVDCVIQEVGPNGQPVWEWRASDHISVDESTHPFGVQSGDQTIYDLFHCNSIDTDPERSLVLLSVRHADAVYLIDQATGRTIWKMGGTSFNRDHAQILTIAGDPDGAFHAQHDARFQSNSDVSLYDNQTWDATLAARGVEYHVDTVAGTATLVWSYQSRDGRNSGATGSFRRLNFGADNVIGWGFKSGTLFTEVDADGNVLLNVAFEGVEFAYRVQKVGLTALNHDLLRATAGLPPSSFTPDLDPAITASGTTLTANEDTAFTKTVANFDDPDPTASASGFLATIAWGDGSSSPGTVSGATGGPFSVTGSHTYARPGTDVSTVYITRVNATLVKATATSTVTVADAAVSATCGTPATSLTAFGAQVATFTDADPNGLASDHVATVAWGDGSSSPGGVSGPEGGPFAVSATHSYRSTGRFNITTTINDVAGSSSSASCSSLFYAFPAGAVAFAIGDKNITNGAPIKFHLVPTSKLDTSDDDSVPARFKELWPKLAPTCGIDWATITGNGSPTVKRPLPDYMGVIVISSVRQARTSPRITAHIEIVRTNATQKRDPGDWEDPGRGVVEAQVC